MSGQCPVCTAAQAESLACHACTSRLERALGDVRSLVTELDTAKSKQARIGNPSGGGGLARERNPISWGAVEAADTLGNVLGTWLRDVGGELPAPKRRIYRMATSPYRGPFCMECDHPSCERMRFYVTEPAPHPVIAASMSLLRSVDAIRRHPAVAELIDEITDAVEQARRAVDRPADRMYLGQCLTVLPGPDGVDVECYAEIWARVDATQTSCRTCGITHEVLERRSGLLIRAADVIVTAKQASEYIGEVGGITVNQKTIRTWMDRQRLPLRPGPTDERHFRLGDLLTILAEQATRTAA